MCQGWLVIAHVPAAVGWTTEIRSHEKKTIFELVHVEVLPGVLWFLLCSWSGLPRPRFCEF